MAVARILWGFIEQRDLRLMRRLHRWRAPQPIRILMLMMSRLGNGWIWYSLGVFILICGGPERYRLLRRSTCGLRVNSALSAPQASQSPAPSL
jgi:hypothetical protein